VSQDPLAALREIDSPTVANAIEHFKLRDRCHGFIGGAIRCLFPDLGVMLGYALPVTMTSELGPPPGREGYWRMWEALERAPKPAVVAVQDVSGAPTRCAYFGEVMATIAARLGAVGVVTDGGVRDLAEVHALGLHYFAPHPVVSHGNFRIVDVGVPIHLDGQTVETGDLLHGDVNGIVVVPPEAIDRLPEVVEQVRERERRTMEFVKSPDFSIEGLKKVVGY
jgi:regulator of RNase E activity RraA